MWLIFQCSPFSCGSGRFLWVKVFNAPFFFTQFFIQPNLLISHPPKLSDLPNYQKIIKVKICWNKPWNYFFKLIFKNTEKKFKEISGNTGTDRSMLLKLKVKWFRCFKFNFFLFISFLPSVTNSVLSPGLDVI